MPKNRSIVILTISLAVLLGSECGFNNYSAHPPDLTNRWRYRFVLPDNYVGWVRIDVGVPKAERWRYENDTATVTIPESGVKQTESELHRKAEMLLYYDRAGDLMRVPDSLYDHSLIANGVTVPLKAGQWELKEGTWYFFVGPSSLRGYYPTTVLAQPDPHVSLPTPGRMAIREKPQTPAGPN